MSETHIPWCTRTWSPVLGCSHSGTPGCDHCFARRSVWRMAHNPNPKVSEPCKGLVMRNSVNRTLGLVWRGTVRTLPDRLDQPSHWPRPQRVFVCPMADLFHPDVPDDFIRRVWNVLWNNPRHRFIILTKRPERLLEWSERREADFYDEDYKPLPALVNNNDSIWPDWCWLGVSAENQEAADKRIPLLLQVPAKHHWVSCEPILGPTDLTPYFKDVYDVRQGPIPIQNSLDWVVVGAESGKDARPDHPAWYLDLIRQCGHARVPLFVKQARAGGRLVKMPAFYGTVIYDEYPKDLTLPSDYAFGGIVRPHTR